MIGHTRRRGPAALDARLRASLLGVAVCGAALSSGALLVLGPRGAFSVAVGAAIAGGNLWLLARIVAEVLRATERTPRGGAVLWSLLALGKMLGLFALVWLLMRSGVVSPLAMVAGFGALPMGIASGALVSDRASRSHK